MKTNTICQTLASVAIGSVLTLGASSASAANMTAVEAVNNFLLYATVNDTDIVNNGCSINWSTYVGHTKGACFVIEILKHGNGYATDYNANAQDFYHLWGHNSPTSAQLFDLVDTAPVVGTPVQEDDTYWRKVTSLGQVQANDVMVIDNYNGYAGHALVVRGPAQLMTSTYSPVWAGTLQYALPIADSTGSAHGCGSPQAQLTYPDTRCATGLQGVGTGYIRIYVDLLTGNIIGHTWSVAPTSSSGYYPNSTSSIGRPIRFGRFGKNTTGAPAPEEPPPPPPPPPPVGIDT